MKPGDVIEGRYLIEALLGEGGMARVFRVRHVGLGSVHALKVLNADLAERVEVRTRFAAEGQIQAQIRHPNIVAVTEVVSEPGLHGLVMDYVEGPPLDAYLASLPQPPPFEVVQAFILPVLDAIGLAHQRGIVHRDLKPENILVGRDGQGRPWPRVTDFGIAKVKQEAESGRATRTGTSMGTRGYMSPEQIKSSKDVSARSDIFSLGATLYELATLRQAFGGDSDYEVMDRIVHERYAPPESVHPGIDGRLARAVRRALRADPANRFATCEEFAAALSGEGFEAASPPGPAVTVDAGLAETITAAKTGIRHDTRPDVMLGALDAATFAPVPGIAEAPTAIALPEGLLDPVAVAPEVAERAWKAVQAWASEWPRLLRDAMQPVGVARVPVYGLRLRASFERREARIREVPFPAGAVPPDEGAPRDDLDAYRVALPLSQVEEGRVETFVVAGTAVVRACTVCRGHGAVTCATCGGAAAPACSTCTGTGSVGCVLCDGTGAVPKLGGDGMTLCPSCRGTNMVPCSAPGCEGGRIRCSECAGKGTQPCHFCGAAGSVARASVVTRASRTSHAHLVAHIGVGDAVRALAETLPTQGEVVASFVVGPAVDLDPRLAPFLDRAGELASHPLARWGSGWQLTRRAVDLHRVPVLEVRYSAGGAAHHVHLVGDALEVIGQPTALELWRQSQTELAAELAEKRDLRGLRSLDLSTGFEPGDERLTRASQRLAHLAEAAWQGGDIAAARALRAATPAPLAPQVVAVLEGWEQELRASNRLRNRKRALAAVVTAVAALIAAAAYASLGGVPSCHLAGRWQGAGGGVALDVSLEVGSLVHATLHGGGLRGDAVLRGSCDAVTRSFVLHAEHGTLAGTLGAGGSVNASWTPSDSGGGMAFALPFARR